MADGLAGRAGGRTRVGQIWGRPWPVTWPHFALFTRVRWAAAAWRASDKRPPIRRTSRPGWAVSAVASSWEVSPAAGDHPISRIRMYVSRHRTEPDFGEIPAGAI